MYRLPLAGIRVLDLTTGQAGPYAGRLLGDMGAEVIKVQSKSHKRSQHFNRLNRNKLGCALDVSHPRGGELLLKLAALSDAVIEDRGGAAEDRDLSHDVLRQARKDIILVAISAGPEDGPVAGISAAGALCAALLYRRRTGFGSRVEVMAGESQMSLMGELVVGFSMGERRVPPAGNRHRSMAPHGCYRCKAGAGWLAIAVGSDAEFAALCRAMGRPDLAADPRFADVVSRYRHQDELDAAISTWTGRMTPRKAAAALQEAGVAAAPVMSAAGLMDDPHLRARRFIERVADSGAGVSDMEGVPWRLSLTPAHVRLSAPRSGQHNEYVLRHLLGLSAEEVAALGQP